MSDHPSIAAIADYWDSHIHDLAVTTHPIGTLDFFKELEAYRYEKLQYLPRLVDFSGYKGKALLEVGCGAGIDLVRFAAGGAHVTGVDLSGTAISLAQNNFAQRGLKGSLAVINGECLEFPDNSFEVVYAHGVLQYTADASKMAAELHRVLTPGGQAILMVYNRYSWLNLMTKMTRVPLEHMDAPAYQLFSIGELKSLLNPFASYRVIPERFPVKTKLHRGWKGRLYNNLFVGAFTFLPRPIIRPFGWHLLAFATKQA